MFSFRILPQILVFSDLEEDREIVKTNYVVHTSTPSTTYELF